jgi:uncharacterized protein (DUF1697 family)
VNTYAALLRGVNVGGRGKVSMQGLRALFESLGMRDVATYVQSGNVVFKTAKSDANRLRKTIEEKIAAELGIQATVLIRSAGELETVLRDNPFSDRTAGDATTHVTFLAEKPSASKLAELADLADTPQSRRSFGDDEFMVSGAGPTEVYVLCPGGYGNTKLNNTFFEKRLAVGATTRNWRTVTKLAEMTT